MIKLDKLKKREQKREDKLQGQINSRATVSDQAMNEHIPNFYSQMTASLSEYDALEKKEFKIREELDDVQQ